MSLGRTLIVIGAMIFVIGVLLTLGERLPVRLGRLPGDLVYRGKNTTVFFPWVTCLVVSVVLTLVTWLFNRR